MPRAETPAIHLMSRSNHMNAAEKKRITADWQREFPALTAHKPMWLMKRHGPLLAGLLLDRTSADERYVPTFHVHNLLAPSPAIVLSLARSAPDVKQPRMARQITLARHEGEYLEAVCFFKQAAPDLDASDLPLSRVTQLHCDFIQEKRDYAVARRCWNIFRDVALLAAWCGHQAYGSESVEAASNLMGQWNLPFDVSEWRATVLELARPEVMGMTISAEIAKHKLERLPNFDLKDDGPGELTPLQVYHATWGTGTT